MENENRVSEEIVVSEEGKIISENADRKDDKKIAIKAARIILPLLIAVLSFTLISKAADYYTYNSNTIQSLREKQETVLKLSAASTAIAAGSSLILGDRIYAVSNKLLDLTGYLIIILSALYLEEYLVAVMGLLSFKILIPISCIIFSLFTIIDRKAFRNISLRIATFAIVMFFAIPLSVKISTLIEEANGSIQMVVESSENLKDEIENYNESDIDVIDDKTDINSTNNDESSNVSGSKGIGLNNFVDDAKNLFNNAKEVVTNKAKEIVGTVTSNIRNLTDKLTTQLNNMVHAIATMIITTCIIPLLVIAFFIWIVKMLFNVDINIDKRKLPQISNLKKN